MKLLIAAVLLMFCATIALADPATAPTTTPAAAPALAANTPATQPATEPSATQADSNSDGTESLPLPGDLIKKLKARELIQSKMPKVAFFDLSHPVQEKPATFSLFGDDGGDTLLSLITRIKQAADDKDIRAVLITLGDHGLNLAQAQEIRNALKLVQRAGKRTFVYADSYDTVGYCLASGASDVCLMEGGEIMIPGVGLETMFLKGLFDKLGVKADYVQIGEYKGADEEYTRTGASNELKGELNKLTDSLYAQIVDGISLNRNLSKEAVAQMIEDTILTGPAAKNRGFVDHLCDEDGLHPLLNKELGSQVQLVHDYGRAEKEAPDLSSPLAFFKLLAKKPTEAAVNENSIALIYAEGVISDGEGSDSPFSDEGIAGDAMRKALRSALRDDAVKAVVIRIDSPGGSALASEVMWQAARRVAEKKPLIISVGHMAASGGYYLASSGQYIFADPSGIVGSIGVVGGKFVYQDLFDKLGLKTEEFKKGNNAGLFSSNEPFTDRQRRMVTNWMKQTYDQFTQRVMTTRAGKIKDIDAVARGRIFVAKQALELGMVDELGGLDDALAYAAKQGGLQPGKYEIRPFPAQRTLADYLGFGGGGPEAAAAIRPKLEIGPDALLRAAAPGMRQLLRQQLQTMQLLEKHPVVLMAPFTDSVK